MKSRLNASLVALAFGLIPVTGEGAILYSGTQNITVTNSFTSVYLDVDAFSSLPTKDTGWDVDVFFGGQGFGNSTNFQPVRQVIAMDSPISRLEAGAIVDSSSGYYNLEAGSSSHIGSSPDQFTSGSEGYLGFRLTENDGDGAYYGWMRVIFSNDGNSGTIIDWAYDNTGAPITVGVVPESSGIMLGGLGGLMMVLRRRRH
jgi:hypothetical protein